jgi:hypothetical protein
VIWIEVAVVWLLIEKKGYASHQQSAWKPTGPAWIPDT